MKNLKPLRYVSLVLFLLITYLTTQAQNLLDDIDPGVCFTVDQDDSEGYLGNGTDDAFDVYGELYIDGDQFSTNTDITIPPDATLGPETYSGLTVTRKIYAYVGPNCASITRYLECFTNNTLTPITTTIQIEGDLGSDSDTQIESTSACGSFWISSSEDGDDWEGFPGGSGDPPLAFNLHGPGSNLPLVSQDFTNGDDEISFTYAPLTVNPGETAYIMHFVTQNQTRVDANAIADALLYPDAAALEGLSESELNSIVNYQLSCKEFQYVLSGGGTGCSTGALPLLMVNITSPTVPADFPIQIVLTDGTTPTTFMVPGPSPFAAITAPGSGTFSVESITNALGCEANVCENQPTVSVEIIDVSLPPLYDPSN